MDSILNSALFAGITPQDAHAMLKCLDASRRKFRKGDFIYHTGDMNASLGILVSGAVHLIRIDVWGSQQLIAPIAPGEIFGEAYACLLDSPFMFDVVAAQDSEILFLSMKKVLSVCSSCCDFHSNFIKNLVMILAAKNMNLNRKLHYVTPKSIRDRVLAYLSDESKLLGKNTFTIPFNRQQMADYLCVDRSALSNELSKMQKEGILTYHKNQFSLLCQTD